MTVTLIKWRDIPSQLVRKAGRRSEKLMLSERFQEAIDRTAMREGVHDTDGYLQGWRRTSIESPDFTKEETLIEVAKHIEDDFDQQKIEKLIQSGGWAEK
ncbi:virulence factor [Sneathiella glossodoripedis]|uniref:virulence factor n=1 Tax=Sneathiella glossodoripedis TaxID=418853 RepID=UPI0004719346|nr:virulence factor [Sneathiella glossodoripedis]